MPGGRIRKNEPMQTALARVAHDELGLDIAKLPHPPVHMGAFEHFYPDSFAGTVGVSTQNVLMGNLERVPSDSTLPLRVIQTNIVGTFTLLEAVRAYWGAPTTTPTACRCSLPTALTTMGLTTSRKS